MKDTFLLDILKTLIGTFAGALVAILTMWLRERADRRRPVNEWFENTFLFQAIEPLLHKARGIILNINLDIEEMPEVLDDNTLSQIQRINQLLRNDTFGTLWTMASSHLKDKEFEMAGMLFDGLSIALRDLQDAALQTTITNRRMIFNLAGTPRYKKVLEGLVEGDKIYQRLLTEMAQRKQLSSSVDSEPIGDEYIP